jgi:hypothetical protein
MKSIAAAWVFGIFLVPKVSVAAEPKMITISCEGQGPSLALARKNALKDCQGSAVERLHTDFKVKSLTVQTEEDSALHEEINSSQEVSGLECLTPKEKIIENPSSYKVSLECHYNPLHVVFKKAEDKINDEMASEEKPLRTSKDNTLIERDGGQSITLATIPACSTIVVESQTMPRVIHCATPTRLVIYLSDQNIIIRAKSYKPKTISAETLRGKNVHKIFLDP